MKRSERKQRRQQRQFERTKAIAHQLYLNRVEQGRGGHDGSDWEHAERIKRNHLRRRAFQLNHWRKHPWRNSINWWESTFIERGLETFVDDLKSLAFVDLASVLADIAIIISLATFLTGGEQRRHDEQVYEAWQVITNAYGQPGNGGRIRALEFLNSTPGTPGRRRWFGLPWDPESLQGIDVSKANLVGIRLPNASLSSANLEGASFSDADLKGAFLIGADLQDAGLSNADLQGATLLVANLQGVYLSRANLKDANLLLVNLQNASFGDAKAFFAGSAPPGFRHFANLQGTSLGGANLLAADLRATQNLAQQQLVDSEAPYLCNTALPSSFKNIDPDRDCDYIPQWLINNDFAPSLEAATKIVDEARQKKWD